MMERAQKRKALKAAWLYPKVASLNPPERWGHSACFFDGALYVFGGCCGGLHFSDVLTLNLETMVWSSLLTSGQKPGTRDSHSTALIGHKMIVFGGTNGSRKVNDLHVLDLRAKEWSKPHCKGTPPSPRESHTATTVGGDRLVIFGGSGEGESNYLNDVHVLDANTMTWMSPEVKGDIPAPRDSHGAVALGSKLFVFGGDCGDRYHGEVDVLDTKNMAWSRFPVRGASPGARAGHAAVGIGSKVFVIGGVGDKQYYGDVWVLDVGRHSWNQLDMCGQQPQGRFAHTAVVTHSDVAIYGGCGEDERPLNELLILQLGFEHPDGRYNNVAMCEALSNHWCKEKREFLRAETHKDVVMNGGEHAAKPHEADFEQRNSFLRGLENGHAKRRKIGDARLIEVETEQEEHPVSLSQHSSPSQSDHDQNGAQKLGASPNGSLPASQPFVRFMNRILRSTQDVSQKPRKVDHLLRAIAPQQRHEVQFLAAEPKPHRRPPGPPLIGAQIHGAIDGAFDSGYLMSAVVDGQLFRGVLLAPGPGVVTAPRPAAHHQILTSSTVPPQDRSALAHAAALHARPGPRTTGFVLPDFVRRAPAQLFPAQAVKPEPERVSADLHDVVLTLGGPGGGK